MGTIRDHRGRGERALVALDDVLVVVAGIDHPRGLATHEDNLYASGEAGQLYRIDPRTSTAGSVVLNMAQPADRRNTRHVIGAASVPSLDTGAMVATALLKRLFTRGPEAPGRSRDRGQWSPGAEGDQA